MALTILASSGLALFAWVQQNLQTASKLRIKEQQARLVLNAQSLLEAVNPGPGPGELVQGSVNLRWTATLVEPPRANAGFAAPSTGPWMVALYRLQVRASDGPLEVDFSMLKVGTQRLDAARPKP